MEEEQNMVKADAVYESPVRMALTALLSRF